MDVDGNTDSEDGKADMGTPIYPDKDDDVTVTSAKKERRSNLAEFEPEQTAKRKNESAKRELTSIVKQVKQKALQK